VFRFMWSLTMHKTFFKSTYGLLIFIQIIISFAVPLILESDTLDHAIKEFVYMTSVCLIQLTEGGHFVLYPVILAELYGPNGGPLAFSIAYSFVGFASITNTLIQPLLFTDDRKEMGFSYIFGCMSILSFIMLMLFFKEPVRKNK